MDVVCFSHLRWNFVYQRPQHLLSRFAGKNRTYYIEEPVFAEGITPFLQVSEVSHNLWTLVQHLPFHLNEHDIVNIQRTSLEKFFRENDIKDYLAWYYTPMALLFSRELRPQIIVYDCMDELSNFKGAPANLKDLESELFGKADIVFTGGHNLFTAKQALHNNIHSFPSSIDKEHFIKARFEIADPGDQAVIDHPRFGFYGVIDERFDIELVREVAEKRPDWNFIIVGPVVKIDPASLPRLNNIHYLGGKSYNELPAYLHGWDIAIIPFVINDSTKYISPTKTPEYLMAGKPVISTPITDVVTPYAVKGLVYIAQTAEDFIQAAEKQFKSTDTSTWQAAVDELLADNSWDNTWLSMTKLLDEIKRNNKNLLTNLNEEVYV